MKRFLFYLIWFFSCSLQATVPAWVQRLRDTDIQVIIFDMDNTIINSYEVGEEAFLKAIEDVLGYPVPQAKKSKDFFYLRFCASDELLAQQLNQYLGVTLFKSGPGGIYNKNIEMLYELIKTKLKFLKGFEVFLASLKAYGFRVALGTNASRRFLKAVNDVLNLSQYFGQHLYQFRQIGVKPKPNPDMFLHAVYKHNASPIQCLVFGDTDDDSEAAKSAKMQFICIQRQENNGCKCREDFISIVDYFSAPAAILRLPITRLSVWDAGFRLDAQLA